MRTISILHFLHLLAVVVWIGGVTFVTVIVFPALYRMPSALEKALLFGKLEHRFLPVAKVSCIVAGATGFALLHLMGGWGLVFEASWPGVGLTVMVLVWALWTAMLFGLEPLVIKKLLKWGAQGEIAIDRVFRRMNAFHFVMLVLSAAAIAGGVWFIH